MISTIMDIFKGFLIFEQIFLSPQMKRSMIVSKKHGINELPHELLKEFRLRILGY